MNGRGKREGRNRHFEAFFLSLSPKVFGGARIFFLACSGNFRVVSRANLVVIGVVTAAQHWWIEKRQQQLWRAAVVVYANPIISDCEHGQNCGCFCLEEEMSLRVCCSTRNTVSASCLSLDLLPKLLRLRWTKKNMWVRPSCDKGSPSSTCLLHFFGPFMLGQHATFVLLVSCRE